MKKVTPLEMIQMSMSNVSTNDVVQTPSEPECRFCKQNEDPQNSPSSLVSPCSCLQPIHSYCLADQMQKNMRGEIISNKTEKRYTCQKCQKGIRFLLQTTHQCRSRQELREFSNKRKCFCFWLTLCMVVMVFLLVAVVVIKAAEITISSVTLTNTILIGASIVVIVLFLLAIFFCLTQVILEERRKVTLITAKPKQRRKFSTRLEIVDC